MLLKIVTWLATHQWMVIVAASAAILTAAYVTIVARAPESIPVEVVVNEVPVCPPGAPTTGVCPPSPVKIAKPIIYVDKASCSFGWNKAALKLLETTHVIHIQYGNGYDTIDLRNDRVEMDSGDWPTSWFDGPITIGIYNPSTGQYAVSVRVE